jgi:hypothetical protein
MKADELLAKAAEIVGGQRAIDYGDKYVNHSRIAALWNMWLTERESSDDDDCFAEVSAYDVAVMMMLVKVARLMHSPGHTDSHLDIAGYAAVMEDIWTEQQARFSEFDDVLEAAFSDLQKTMYAVPPEDVR